MEIPTSKTQLKIAELLHDLDGCQPESFEQCSRRGDYVTKAALFLGLLMPSISTEMFPAVRADERDKVAYHIVAELVCCDIHIKLEEAAQRDYVNGIKNYGPTSEWFTLRQSHDYHDICHYGGWAASLAKLGPVRDNRHDGWEQGVLFMPEKE